MIGKMWYNNYIDALPINKIDLASQWKDDTRQSINGKVNVALRHFSWFEEKMLFYKKRINNDDGFQRVCYPC